MGNPLFRHLPSVETLKAQLTDRNLPEGLLTQGAREVLDDLRSVLLTRQQCPWPLENGKIAPAVLRNALDQKLAAMLNPSLRRVINASGVIVHTNLGRAPLSADTWKRMEQVATRYSNLEYDIVAGHRGSRFVHAEAIMARLTGAPGCVVVNNNAAAVLLVLTAFARGREVVIARNELIEIGGSFRLPDIMAQGGARLRDVGTTNKVHRHDYEDAIGDNTGLLMKAHWSNYSIEGFTKGVARSELVKLAREREVPFFEDLGSGLLQDLSHAGLHGEDTVQQVVEAGVDLVSFSGDKMLGGPQAGIVLGSRTYIDRLKKHPLTRALRPDKLTLAGLEAVALSYLEGRHLMENPVMTMLQKPMEALEKQAESLQRELTALPRISASMVACDSRVGGGALPASVIPSRGVTVALEGMTDQQLETALRGSSPTIITRRYQGRVLLDVRTLFPQETGEILKIFKTLVNAT